ncbi:hypothetical protein FPV67DRAFT_1504023 [Lyophyllum atratum]|nr:hypothetical protein FPV67DRAFT_1504023 [Lyophyllum atratum]
MSPDRQRASSSTSSKPYSRPTTPDTPSKRQSIDIAQQESVQTTVISKPGYPTYAQYKNIEDNYLATLTPSRREKALISQKLFDRIWAVLHSPDKGTETAQFRFWVRKQFTFGIIKSKSSSAASTEAPSETEAEPNQTVLLHEKNLVAVQDQIYDILCYSHGMSGHAGRDKTVIAVRQHYTWIPKELVARFIKACPTCVAKKCGLPQKAVRDQNATPENILPSLRQYLRNIGTEDDRDEEMDDSAEGDQVYAPKSMAKALPDIPGPMFDPSVMPAPLSAVENVLDRVANLGVPPGQSSCLRSLPMTREVSLYQGLPNGWQYRHENLAAAHDEFMLRKVNMDFSASSGRPVHVRIPSIAPMMQAFTAPCPGDNGTLPPLQLGTDDAKLGSSPSSLSLTLPPLQIPTHVPSTPQADPALFYSATGDTLPMRPELPLPTDIGTQAVPPTRIIRAGAPLSIDLESLSSQKTIQAFLDLRDTSSHSPQSPQPQVPLTSPAGSDSSQLSAFPMSFTHSLSPTNTELLTPCDEAGPSLARGMGLGDKVARDLVEKASSMMLNMSTEAVCDHGPGVIVL